MTVFFRGVPKMFFLLLPWFAFLLWLFFRQRGTFLYVDPAVFALHFHSFAFIAMMLGVLLSFLPVRDVGPVSILSFVSIVYFFIAVRKFYERSWLYTLLVGGLVGTVYMTSLIFLALGYVLVVMLTV